MPIILSVREKKDVGGFRPNMTLGELQAATAQHREKIRGETSIPALEAYKAQLEALLGTAKEQKAPNARVESIVAPGVVDARERAKQLQASADLVKFPGTETVHNAPVDPQVKKTWGNSVTGAKTANNMYDLLFDIEDQIKKFQEAQTKYDKVKNTGTPVQQPVTGVFPGSVNGPLDQTTPLAGTAAPLEDDRAQFIRDMQRMVSDAKRKSSYVPVFGFY